MHTTVRVRKYFFTFELGMFSLDHLIQNSIQKPNFEVFKPIRLFLTSPFITFYACLNSVTSVVEFCGYESTGNRF